MDQRLINLLITNIILDTLTLPLPVLLMVQVLHRKHRSPEMVLFFRMCVFCLLLCLSYIGSCVLLLNYSKIPAAYIFDIIFNFLIGLFPLLMAVHWLLFVEYTLHHSKDIIWRRYPIVMIPFGIGVLITFLESCIPIPDSAPIYIQQIFFYMYRTGQLIWCFYFGASYIILIEERKRKIVPEYIRLTPTVLSCTLGLFFFCTAVSGRWNGICHRTYVC